MIEADESQTFSYTAQIPVDISGAADTRSCGGWGDHRWGDHRWDEHGSDEHGSDDDGWRKGHRRGHGHAGILVVNTATLENGKDASAAVCVKAAAFRISKEVSSRSVGPGETVTYEVTVSNVGDVAGSTTFVDVNDVRVSGLSAVTTDPVGGSCVPDAVTPTTLDCTTGMIEADESQTFTYTAQIPVDISGAADTRSCGRSGDHWWDSHRWEKRHRHGHGRTGILVVNTATLANGKDASASVCVKGVAPSASVTIVKEQLPAADGTTFLFDSSDMNDCVTEINPFISDRVDCSVVPGTYHVTELDPAPGSALTGLVCDDADSSGDVASRTATIVVGQGEHVTCTFANTDREEPQATVTVVKEQLPEADGTTFLFDSSDMDDCVTSINPFISDRVECSVVPGTYHVTELDPAPGAALTGLVCDDADSSGDVASRTATIVVAEGEHVTCTFTNTDQEQPQASVTIVKEQLPEADGTTFLFDSSDMDDCVTSINPFISDRVSCSVVPGTYHVTEQDPAPGSSLTGLVCDDTDSSGDVPSRTATIVVGEGEHVTCTFTNTDVTGQTTMSLSKSAPQGAFPGQQFDWTITVTNTGTNALTGAQVVDTLPTEGSFVSSTPAGTPPSPAPGATYTVALPTIPAGGSSVVTIRWTAPTPGPTTLHNTASATATNAPSAGPATADVQVGLATNCNPCGVVGAGTGLRMRDHGDIALTGIPAGATVGRTVLVWAILYDGSTTPPNTITFEGHTITADVTQTISGNLCWGDDATIGYAADVTAYVTGNGTYTVSNPANGVIRPDDDPFGTLPYTDGASLITFYAGGGSNNQVLSDFSYNTNTAGPIDRSFTGINSVGGAASILMAGPDGQNNAGETFTFTGSSVITLDGTWEGSDPQVEPSFGIGNLWDTDTYDMSSIIPAGQTSLTFHNDQTSDCVGVSAAVVQVAQ
jgi:uncharacterized repeat protein (TIGR01451 family)